MLWYNIFYIYVNLTSKQTLFERTTDLELLSPGTGWKTLLLIPIRWTFCWTRLKIEHQGHSSDSKELPWRPLGNHCQGGGETWRAPIGFSFLASPHSHLLCFGGRVMHIFWPRGKLLEHPQRGSEDMEEKRRRERK